MKFVAITIFLTLMLVNLSHQKPVLLSVRSSVVIPSSPIAPIIPAGIPSLPLPSLSNLPGSTLNIAYPIGSNVVAPNPFAGIPGLAAPSFGSLQLPSLGSLTVPSLGSLTVPSLGSLTVPSLGSLVASSPLSGLAQSAAISTSNAAAAPSTILSGRIPSLF